MDTIIFKINICRTKIKRNNELINLKKQNVIYLENIELYIVL